MGLTAGATDMRRTNQAARTDWVLTTTHRPVGGVTTATSIIYSLCSEPRHVAMCVTIKTAMLQGVIHEAAVGVEGWSEDKHARVEAVRPAGIRSCRQLVSLKQLVHVTQNLRGNRSIRGHRSV